MTIQMFPVVSSNLKAVGYNPTNKVLRIIFHGGAYDYFEVSASVYEELMNADSKGQHHHRYIRDFYRYRRIG